MDRANEILLMEYAAGVLDCAHNVLVASYLTLSPEGRRIVAECEHLGAALFESECECAEMGDSCLEAVLARIDAAPAEERTCSCCQILPGLREIMPKPLALAVQSEGKIRWRRGDGFMWAGLRFENCSGAAGLIRVNPGTPLPDGAGQERVVVLVLDGTLLYGDARLGRGALLVLEEECEYKPFADPAAGCVALAVMARTPCPGGLRGRVMALFH